jgi:MFS family permease
MRTFQALVYRNYRLYFFGQMVSLIGSWAQSATLSVLAYSLTGQNKWAAAITIAQIGPTFLFGALGGMIADRFSKVLVITITQLVFLATAITLMILQYFNSLTITGMLSVMALHGVAQAVDLPARLALLGKLVPKHSIANAVALNALLFNVARLLGPLTAGILLRVTTPVACFAINALSYGAVLFALYLMHIPRTAESDDSAPSPKAKGWRVYANYPNLLKVIFVVGIVSVAGWPTLSLLPGKATEIWNDPRGGADLLSSVGLGAILATLTIATFGEKIHRKALVFGPVSIVIGLIGLSLLQQPLWALLSCMWFGFGMLSFLPSGQSIVQLGVAERDRGTIMGLWASVLAAGVPIGNLVIGPLADEIGPSRVLMIQAGVVLFIPVLVLILGIWRK